MAIAPKRRAGGRPAAPPPRHGPEPQARSTGARRFAWRPPALYFAIGLLCRLVVFTGPHHEGDEIVYRELVMQLEAGRGYTLQGTPLLDQGWPADQYGRALFFHPPGGIGLFWLLHRAFGDIAFPLAQVLSYALFFWSMVALARIVLAPLRGLRLHVVSALAAFTPLMTHVTSRYWLDGPMLAFTTLAVALFLAAVARRSTARTLLAALVMGYASWIKSAAFVMLPGLLILAWALAEPDARSAVRLGAIFCAVALLLQLPWEIWQWRVVGSPFPAWAGKPSPQLVAENPYVYNLTVVRPAWMYLTLMPRAVWTLVPSIAGLAGLRLDPRTRRIGLALLAWILAVLAVVMGLGAIGYSKLLRYAILVTPATVLLFGLVAGVAWSALIASRSAPAGRGRARALVAMAAAGLALEIAQGMFTPLLDRAADVIQPVLGHDAWIY